MYAIQNLLDNRPSTVIRVGDEARTNVTSNLWLVDSRPSPQFRRRINLYGKELSPRSAAKQLTSTTSMITTTTTSTIIIISTRNWTWDLQLVGTTLKFQTRCRPRDYRARAKLRCSFKRSTSCAFGVQTSKNRIHV